jgi:hypothetical protein
MEAIIAAGNDQPIPELSVSSHQDQASYVISRVQTSTTCATPVLSPTSVRTAKISIVDGNFLDLSTLFFSFSVFNSQVAPNDNSATPLQPLSAIPHGWFRRAVVKINGATCEDVSSMARVEEQVSRFASTNKRRNWGDAGHSWDTLTDDATDAKSKTIARGARQAVTWRPLSLGFLQMKKYLPMMGGSSGLTIELELSDSLDAVLDGTGNSTSWHIENLQCHVDSVQLTSEMTNKFATILQDGGTLLLPYQANSCDVLYLDGSTNQTLSLAKQYSRLATVMVSLGVDDAATPALRTTGGVMRKAMNNFYLGAINADGADAISSHIQVNNQRWPQFDIVGAKQHFFRMLQGIGVLNSVSHAVSISSDGYGGTGALPASQFLVAYDLEAVPHRESTGMAVQGGGTVQIKLKNCGEPKRAFVTTHYDAVLEIRSQGAISYS